MPGSGQRALSQGGRVKGMHQLRDQITTMTTDVQGALVYILEGLKDPKRPTACAGTLFCCLFRIYTANEQPDLGHRIWLSKIHGLWFCLYDFIVAKRTDDEFLAMVQRLSTCTCRMDWNSKVFHFEMTQLHKLWNSSSSRLDDGRSDTWKFPGLACKLLRSIMEVSKDKSVLRGVSKRWPPSGSELLPHGPDELMKSLLQWHRLVGDCVVGDLLPAVIRLGGPRMYGSIAKAGAIETLVIDPIRHHLNRTLDDMKSESKARKPASPTYDFEALGKGLHSCLEEVFRPPIRSNLQMLNGAETKALQLCSIILYLLPVLSRHLDTTAIAAFKALFSMQGQKIFRIFRMELPGRPDIPLHPLIVKHDAAMSAELRTMRETFEETHSETPIIDVIAAAMVECHESKPCAAPGCHLTFRDNATAFKKCGRCQTLGYCSKECQIRHWSEGNSPHKRSCKIMRKISDERGGWDAPTPGAQELDDSVSREYDLSEDLSGVISKMRREWTLTDEELVIMMEWVAKTASGMNEAVERDAEWHPGYDDYEEIIERIANFVGPKPAFMDRASLLELPPERTLSVF